MLFALISCAKTEKANENSKDALLVAVICKQPDTDYFLACKTGFEKAAGELGFTLLFDGPKDGSVDGQKEVIRHCIKDGAKVSVPGFTDLRITVSDDGNLTVFINKLTENN